MFLHYIKACSREMWRPQHFLDNGMERESGTCRENGRQLYFLLVVDTAGIYNQWIAAHIKWNLYMFSFLPYSFFSLALCPSHLQLHGQQPNKESPLCIIPTNCNYKSSYKHLFEFWLFVPYPWNIVGNTAFFQYTFMNITSENYMNIFGCTFRSYNCW